MRASELQMSAGRLGALQMVNTARQRGFLLIEVLIAFLIITVALIAIAGLFINGAQANSNAAAVTAATELAQRQLELLKQQPVTFWQGRTLPYSEIPWQDQTEMLPITINNIKFTVNTTADSMTDNNNLVQVAVTVKWTEVGKIKSVQLTALYPKK